MAVGATDPVRVCSERGDMSDKPNPLNKLENNLTPIPNFQFPTLRFTAEEWAALPEITRNELLSGRVPFMRELKHREE